MIKTQALFAVLIFCGIFAGFFLVSDPTGFVTQKPIAVDNEGPIASENAFVITKKVTYPVIVEIIEQKSNEQIEIGVAKSFTELDFGKVPGNGSEVTKTLLFENKEMPTKIRLSRTGNISPYISFESNGFILEKFASRDIGVFLDTEGMNIGNYSGEVIIETIAPKHEWLYEFLRFL